MSGLTNGCGVVPLTVGGDYPYWPNTGYPSITYPWTFTYTEPPRECSGDVHVFPCPHCDKCKCGGAVKTKGKR